jgi:hypothetical protein
MRRLILVATIAALSSCGTNADSPSAQESSEPSADVCAATEIQLVDVLRQSPEERLDCFGNGSVTFVAYVSGMVGAGTCTISPIPGDGWLNLCGGPSRILVAAPGDEEGLKAYLPPSLDLGSISMDTWVRATGHFDDPAAATCDREGASGPANDPEQARQCRMAFVLESAIPEE